MSGEVPRQGHRQMPRLTDSCPDCGAVAYPPERAWLVEMSVADRSHYCFICPGCDEVVRRPASERLRDLLRRWVPSEYWVVPQEALETRPDSPLTMDDVLDTLLALRELPVTGDGDGPDGGRPQGAGHGVERADVTRRQDRASTPS